MQKRRRRRQNALRRFLTTSATIGRKYAHNFYGASLQGVPLDSLESFKAVGAGEMVDTPALRAFPARAAPAIILYVL